MSLNDPQWGRRGGGGGGGGNQGPPDLDELWRNFNQRLAAIFGRRGGGTPGGEPPNFRQLGGGAGLLVFLVLVVWLASGFYIVDASQRGVVLTFGKYSQTTEPGLRWRWPYPIQSQEIVNISQVRTIEVGYRNNVKSKVLREALMLTDDENIVDIQFAVQYTIKDPRGLPLQRTGARTRRCCRSRSRPSARSSASRAWTSCSTRAARRSPPAPRS